MTLLVTEIDWKFADAIHLVEKTYIEKLVGKKKGVKAGCAWFNKNEKEKIVN